MEDHVGDVMGMMGRKLNNILGKRRSGQQNQQNQQSEVKKAELTGDLVIDLFDVYTTDQSTSILAALCSDSTRSDPCSCTCCAANWRHP